MALASRLLAAARALWLVLRKRPTAEEIERARRQFLVAVGTPGGRHVARCLRGGNAADGRTLTMLLFSYRIGGVDYECSQDITAMLGEVDGSGKVRAGFPLLRALPARQPAEQHRRGRGLDRAARGPAAVAASIRRPRAHRPSHLGASPRRPR